MGSHPGTSTGNAIDRGRVDLKPSGSSDRLPAPGAPDWRLNLLAAGTDEVRTMTSPGQAPAAGGHRDRRPVWIRRPVSSGLALAVVYSLAVVVGRATRIDGSALALVWPAAAVGFCWLAAYWQHRRLMLGNAVALTVLASVINAVTGTGWAVGVAFGVANAVQSIVACAVMNDLQSRSFGERWQLRRSSDLTALILASFAGSLAAAVIGPVALHLSAGAPLVATAGAWILRNAVSTFAFSAVVLRLIDSDLPPSIRDRRQGRELAGAAVVITAAYVAVFVFTEHLPLGFLLLPLSLWLAMRFDTTISAVHVMLVGVLVVGATMAGHGPFAIDSVSTRVLLAQAYVAVAGLVALVLAMHRDERHQLIAESRDAHARADQQAELLAMVLASMDEGVILVDAQRRILVRNPAAEHLMGDTGASDGVMGDPDRYGLFSPGGLKATTRQMADVRALGGEQVAEDYVLRPETGLERILEVRGTPLDTVTGERQALVVFSDVTSERRAASEISQARDLFSAVLDASTEFAIISTDLQNRITVFNAGAEQMLGYHAEEVLGTLLWDRHDRGEISARAAELGIDAGPEVLLAQARAGHAETRQWTYLRRDTSRLQVSLTVTAMRDPAGAITGFIGVARDITAQTAAEAELRDSEERFRLAFDTAPVGMMIVALVGPDASRILRVNATLCDFTGWSQAELLALDLHALAAAEDVDVSRTTFAAFAGGELTKSSGEQRYVRSDGTIRWGLLSAIAVDPGSGTDPYLLCLIEDITARKEAERSLTHLALHDALTGLPNRVLLGDRLAHAVDAARRSGEQVGVLYCDLDGFKAVNDTAGHPAGDELLREVTQRIGRCLRPADTLARLGGDEFAIICPGIGADHGPAEGPTGLSNLTVVAERILSALRVPIELSAGTFTIGVSIGMSIATAQTSPEQALHAADSAMYEAKRAGKNRAQAHDPDDDLENPTTQLLEELNQALMADELLLYAQPVVDLATGQIVAVETLIRWMHPRRGLLAPADFLAIAEASPLMAAIGRRVLEESCRMAAAWTRTFAAAAPDIHVNFSGRQLETEHFYDDIVAVLQHHQLPGNRLVLELTETYMPLITSTLRADLQRLRDLGVRIAIDDLGTGYSSLARLTDLPVDILKIDLAFIAGLGTDPSCDAVVRAILSIGHALGLSVVAEGFETPAQAEILRVYGCDTVQGYLYSPPITESGLVQLLRESPSPHLSPRPAPIPGQLMFRCGDVLPGCTRTFTGPEQEILLSIADHVRVSHGLPEIPAQHLRQVRKALLR
jgi:diguanylate cyclase (GGDEF)-like protein/PAS domain S-box-containing protein